MRSPRGLWPAPDRTWFLHPLFRDEPFVSPAVGRAVIAQQCVLPLSSYLRRIKRVAAVRQHDPWPAPAVRCCFRLFRRDMRFLPSCSEMYLV